MKFDENRIAIFSMLDNLSYLQGVQVKSILIFCLTFSILNIRFKKMR